MNPFVFHRPVGPGEVIGRERDAAALLEAVETGVNATLYAPRRFGKTSLIAQVLADADVRLGMAAISVDCYGVLTREDFAARVAGAYRALPGRLGRRVREMVESAEAGVTIAGTGVKLGARGRPAGAEALLIDLLDLPLRVLERTGGRTVVAFDEFQAVADVPGLDGLLRSRIQHHGEAAAYLFAGSEVSLLAALFNDRSRPLYGQSRPMRLGRLPAAETLPAIAARFEATGRAIGRPVLGWLVEAGDGHPQRTMLLAHHLWAATPARGEATEARWARALAAALDQLSVEFETQWTVMTANERRVVAALSAGVSPLSRDGRDLGLKRPSSAQKSLEALLRRGIAEREDDGVRIVDPLLARWVTELRGR
jgi:uncharacterized protein